MQDTAAELASSNLDMDIMHCEALIMVHLSAFTAALAKQVSDTQSKAYELRNYQYSTEQYDVLTFSWHLQLCTTHLHLLHPQCSPEHSCCQVTAASS